ncbi:unnamed protein product [Rangifer tarandus platyrhynchus]|uniref:Uncharacterized protein n=1 Tax=Rangifer tarandus platyrhynchus TaxID=3082113 RepID=A0AC59Z2A9_RANTA
MPSVLRQRRARTREKWKAAQLGPASAEWPQPAPCGAQELLSAVQSAQALPIHFKAPGGQQKLPSREHSKIPNES